MIPTFAPLALKHSETLTQLIRHEIELSGGYISFSRFMELALYAPGLGYYSAGQHKLGVKGDFVTAPEISSFFAKCIARQCQQILTTIAQGDILEFGAGSGVFAKDVLLELEKLNALPNRYYILEISAELQERQKQLLAEKIPHLLSRVEWLQALPDKINGIIFANEVVDAMPVHLFQVDAHDVKERCVVWANNQFLWKLMPPTDKNLQLKAERWVARYHLPEGYQFEMNIRASAWLNSVLAILNTGIVLLIDYGYGEAEFFHPERNAGTLKCFSQHQQNDDPLQWVGLQDITAHVNFTDLLENAEDNGWMLAGFTTQASFLLACGLLELAEQEQSHNVLEQHQRMQALKQLIMPGQMGELVKVLGIQKNCCLPLMGFSMLDRRGDL